MSLRAFHFVFIIASIFLSIGLAVYGIAAYQTGQELSFLIFGGVAALLSVVLTGYGIWFARKSSKIII